MATTTKDQILGGVKQESTAGVKQAPIGDNAASTTTSASSEAGREVAPTSGNTPNQSPNQSPEKSLTYEEMFEQYFPGEQPLSAKEQKRQRREAVYSALGDGISALSNLYYTNRYAPSAYDPSASLSKKNNERWQKLIADRKSQAQQYYNAQMRAMQADDLQAIRKQNADANEAYKRSQVEKNASIASAQQEIAAARVRKDTSAAALAEQKLEYLKEGWPVELATKQAQLDLEKAKADNAQREADDKHAVAQSTVNRNNASAEKSRSGGSGSGGRSGSGRIPWYDEDGNLQYAKTEAEAKQQSKQHGTYVDDYADNSSTKFGITSSTHTHNGWHSQKPAAPAKPTRPAQSGRSNGGGKPQQPKPQAKKKTGVKWN